MNSLRTHLNFDKDSKSCYEIFRMRCMASSKAQLYEYFALISITDSADTAIKQGIIHHYLSLHHEAIKYFNEAIKIDPNMPDAHVYKALSLLQLGEYKKGFFEYELRWKLSALKENIFINQSTTPKWSGESLEGKSIYLFAEHGFGDAIQFSRYVELLKSKGALVYFECHSQLVRLFNNLGKSNNIIMNDSAHEVLPKCDYYSPLMSIPNYLSQEEIQFSNKNKYIHLPSSPKNNKKFKIGICWAGDAKRSNDGQRSLPSDEVRKLSKKIASSIECEIHSLQHGNAATNFKVDGITSFQAPINDQDFFATAEYIMELDVIISVCTSVAHLAGALGKKTLVLLPYVADWRWGIKEKKSNWYSDCTLFRQQRPGDWEFAFEEVVSYLNTHPKRFLGPQSKA